MPVARQATRSVGFDVDQQLSFPQAVAFAKAGKTFCIRYIPRTPALVSGNLTRVEISNILNAGLNLMVVQHVPMPGWSPTGTLGVQYGKYAVAYCIQIGLTKGVTVWLDLESVNTYTESGPQNIIDYCNQWYTVVSAAGYVPGLYVGYGPGLSAEQLYDLEFKHYWRAYNGPEVATCGYQVVQQTQQTLNGIQYDPNTLQPDNEGRLPFWLSPS